MRAFVFIDYQNMYKGAREAFGWTSEMGHFGSFRPLAMARTLTHEADRELLAVHVYTGMPTPEHDPRGHGPMQRRTQAWEDENPQLVKVHTRPLRYPPPVGREKGIDVELALDVVSFALDDAYDLLVLASADSDIVPALEFVLHRCSGKEVETVAFEPLRGYEAEVAEPIDIPGGGVHSRRLITKTDFNRMEDRRNFVNPRSSDPVPGQSGRRLPPGRRPN